jgi:hypothetical protein
MEISNMSASKLSDAQLVLLSSAAQHPQGAIKLDLKRAAAKTVAAKLPRGGFIEEVPSGGTLPEWRRDDGLGSLDLTRILAGHHGDYSGMARSENQAFHRQRFREAVQAIGKIGSHVLDSAVCRETPLEQVGYALGWGNRAYAYAAAAERMKIALDGLCRLWGIG